VNKEASLWKQQEKMGTIISLLRGINVGPNKTVPMKDLVLLYESLGLKNVRTYLRSGNVLFDSPGTDLEKLPAMLEDHIAHMIGFPVKVIMRDDNDLREIIRNNPLMENIPHDVTKLHVTFLSAFPPVAAVNEVNGINDPADRVTVVGREAYLFCPEGYGRTRFSNTFLEKKLGVVATTRNWNTVITLSEMAKGSGNEPLHGG
jgi:uncharacterized protein (DUF1697 family)